VSDHHQTFDGAAAIDGNAPFPDAASPQVASEKLDT